MTDGGENSSREYSLERVRKMIKHQTDKYNWTFMYLGADITTSQIADSMGIKYRGFSSKIKLGNSYEGFNTVLSSVRCGATLDSVANDYSELLNAEFEKDCGIKLKNKGED